MKRTFFKNPITKSLGLLTALSLAFVSCDSDDEMEPTNSENKGTANIGVTDAAIDAENVTGVYLKVEGIMVDGDDNENDTTVMFNSTQEFNLMAYQNGEVFDLTSIELNQGTYSDISFILASDEKGYVTFSDNTQSEIELEGTSSNEYEIAGEFEVMANSTTDLVADIDLRKALHQASSETSAKGEFMLRSTARLVEVNTSGTIEGSIENYNELKSAMDSANKESKVVVYAYLKGQFEESEREDPDGEDGVKARFENSVNSAVVKEDGTFTLAFLNDGEYEVAVASFEKGEEDAEEEPHRYHSLFELSLVSDTNLGLFLDGVDVSAQSETDLNIMLNWK